MQAAARRQSGLCRCSGSPLCLRAGELLTDIELTSVAAERDALVDARAAGGRAEGRCHRARDQGGLQVDGDDVLVELGHDVRV